MVPSKLQSINKEKTNLYKHFKIQFGSKLWGLLLRNQKRLG